MVRLSVVKVFGVVPASGSSIQGIRRVESGMKWVHYVGIDGVLEVSPEDAAKSVIEIARNEGIFVGLSSGAVYAAYRKLLEEGKLEDGDYILILPDMGFKYVEQLLKYISG